MIPPRTGDGNPSVEKTQKKKEHLKISKIGFGRNRRLFFLAAGFTL